MATRTKKPPAAKGRSDEDDFDQGGADGAAKQRGKGDNSKKFDGALINEALEDIAALELRMAKRLEEANKKNQPDRDKIKQIKDELVESGIPSRELGTLIRKRKLEEKLENIDQKLDDDQKETFASLVEALGSFADSPLGKAALKKAEARK